MADGITMLRVKSIIESDPARRYVVVSAPGKRFGGDIKVTDLLYETYDNVAVNGETGAAFEKICERFRGIVSELKLDMDIDAILAETGEAIVKEASPDFCASRGEYLSGRVMAELLGIPFIDARDVVKFGPDGKLDNKRTYALLAEALKGKDAVFAVTLNSLQGRELPEVDDEFIKNATGSETLDAYKAKVRERLEAQAKRRSTDDTENSILNAVAATAEAEIPQAMIDREIDGLIQKFEVQLMYQGLKLQDYLDFLKVTMADFRKNYEDQAKKNVLNQLVIAKIIKDEKIEATEEEVDEKVAEQAASVDKTPEEYRKGMDPRQFDYIRSDIIITKLFDFLKANNEMYTEENE